MIYPSDMVAKAVARLPFQFKNSKRIQASISATIKQWQDIVTAAATFDRMVYINDGAGGSQLDLVAGILDIARGSLSDLQLRAYILATVAEYNSTGNADDIISVVKLLTGAPGVNFRDAGNAHFIMEVEGINPLITETMLSTAIEAAKAAGVSYGLTIEYIPTFGFDDDLDPNVVGFDRNGILAEILT